MTMSRPVAVSGAQANTYSNPNRPVVFVVYAGALTGGEPVACEEVEAVGLFDPTELPALAFEHDARIVSDWLTFTSYLVKRKAES